MKQPTQLFPAVFASNSDVYSSRERSAYCIGRPDGARMALYNVSQREAEEIVTNLPDELLEKVKEHYNLVPAPENVATPGGGLTEITGMIPEEPEKPDFIDPADDWLDEKPAPQEPEQEEEPGVDLKTLNLSELKDLAKELNIVGVSRYTADQKDELINLIEHELKKIDDVNDEDEL